MPVLSMGMNEIDRKGDLCPKQCLWS